MSASNPLEFLSIHQADLDKPDHQQAIVELLDHYARIPIIKGDGLSERVRRELIPGLKAQPNCIVVLAFLQEEPVGVAICFIGYSTFYARPLINIHDLAIRQQHRGQGIGRRVLSYIEDKAIQLGCCKVTLEVNQNNHGARRLYDRQGFNSAAMQDENSTVLFCAKRIFFDEMSSS